MAASRDFKFLSRESNNNRPIGESKILYSKNVDVYFKKLAIKTGKRQVLRGIPGTQWAI